MTDRMHVLVTGATGFIGSHVVRRLVADGHAVTVLVRPASDLGRIADLAGSLNFIHGDLGAAANERLARDIAEAKPGVTIHCAWTGVAGAARNNRAQNNNFAATFALLDACIKAGVERWVGLGSQAEYGPSPGIIDEAAPARPTTLYGAVKAATHIVAEALCRQSNMGFAWIRVFSVYGPGDSPAWVIPSLALALARGERPALTEGTQLWDFLHVRDAAAAIALLAGARGHDGVFNLGSGQTRTIRSIAENVRDLIDPGLGLGFGEIPFRPDQVMHLEADVTRLKTLGWAPRVPWTEGLKETVLWYRDRATDFKSQASRVN